MKPDANKRSPQGSLFSFFSRAAQYGIAVAAVALAALLRMAIDPILGDAFVFPTFFLAVLATSLLTGIGPTIACAVLGFLASDWLFYFPRHFLNILTIEGVIVASIYAAVVLPIVLFGQLWRKAKRGAEALRQKEELMRIFVEHAPISMAMFDTDMRYLAVSRRWLRDYNIKERNILGRTHYEVFPEIPERWKLIHRRCLAGATERAEEDEFRRADGSIQWLRWEVLPWYKTAGAIGGVIMFTEDITARKQAEKRLERSEARLRFALAAANAGSWELEPEKDEHVWSDRFWELFNLTPHCCKPSYQLFINAILPEDRPAVDRSVQKLIESGEIYMEFRVPVPGGVRWLMSRGCSLDGQGKAARYLGLVMDITKQKKAEEVLQRDKDQLEKLVGQRTERMLDAERELGKAKRLSDIGTLASTVAHELRNPLAAISMASRNIKRKAVQAPVQRSLFTIEKKVAESDQIINNLLFYSRLRRPEFGQVDIYRLLEEAAQSIKAVLPQSVTLEVNVGGVKGVVMEADPLQVRELLMNILNNAADAVRVCDRGRIGIDGREDNGGVEIRVRDNGTGMDRMTLMKVREMQPFYSTKSKGTGLGLSVCKQIVALHGGSIAIDSEKDEGTSVTIRLPVKQPALAR